MALSDSLGLISTVGDEGWRGVVVHVACDRVDFRGESQRAENEKNFCVHARTHTNR